jgi:hypothetical protein
MILDNIKMLAVSTAAKMLVKTSVGQAITKKAVEKFMDENGIPGSVTTPTPDDHKWVVELGSPDTEACMIIHAGEDLICQLCEAYAAHRVGNIDRCNEIVKNISSKLLTR